MNRYALNTLLSATSALVLAGCCWGPNAKTPTTAGDAAPVEAAWPAMPTPGPVPSFTVPKSTTFKLANGMPVTLVTMGAVPLVELQLNVYTGSGADPAGREGLAAVTADLLNEGAGDMDALALESALQRLASDVSFGAARDASVVRINSLEDKLEPTLELVRKMLVEPTFSEADLARVVEDRQRALQADKDDLATVGFRAFNKVLWGDNYIGRPGGGDDASLGAITRAEVTDWHKDVWTPANAGLVVVSRLTEAQIKPMLDASLGSWTGSGKAKPPQVTITAPEAKKGVSVYWVDKPGQSQSYVIVGNVAPGYDPRGDELRDLANYPVGGNFTARINMNLREDKGYTYGARSWFDPSLHGGTFAAAASVKADTTAASITELLKELQGPFGDAPVTEAEHSRSQASLIQAEPSQYERMGSTLGRYAQIDQLKAPVDTLTGRSARIRAITLAQATEALSAALSGEDLVVVVVGDRALAGPAVEELGLGAIVPLDDEGNPL